MMGDMDIVEFLKARIAEDEAVAQKAAASATPAMDASREPIGLAWEAHKGMVLGQPDASGYSTPLWDNEGSSTLSMHPDASAHVARHNPARVLAECEAKRAIIQAFDPQRPDLDPYVGRDVIAMLAAVYKDHADYNPDWSFDTRA